MIRNKEIIKPIKRNNNNIKLGIVRIRRDDSM